MVPLSLGTKNMWCTDFMSSLVLSFHVQILMGLLYACDRWIGANRVFKKIEWQKLERERYNKVKNIEFCQETY